jgi:hypothetical protein
VTRFSEGRESVTDERDQDGQQHAELKKTLHENRRLTVRSIAEQANIDRETGKS